MSKPTVSLTNPWATVHEDELVRFQTDVPRKTKAYIMGILGRRGVIQEILNTTLKAIEDECRSANITQYDNDNEQFIAGILGRLQLTNRPAEGQQPNSEYNIVGAETGRFSKTYFHDDPATGRISLSTSVNPSGPVPTGCTSPEVVGNPAPPDPVSGGNAGDDNCPAPDADRPANDEGKPERRKPRATGNGKGKATQVTGNGKSKVKG
jgi:hypothetical protein